jgi:Tol biopolymer transport system component
MLRVAMLLAALFAVAGCGGSGSVDDLTDPSVPWPGDADPAWSPDGRWLAFTRDADDTLRVVDVRTREMRVVSDGITNTWGRDFAWSPDGRRLAFVRGEDQTLHVFDVRTVRVTEVMDGATGLGRRPWSPDGRMLAVPSTRDGTKSARCFGVGTCPELYVVAAAGGEPQRLTVNETYERAPVWSPDGRRLAFLTGHEPDDSRAWRDVAVVDVNGGRARAITDDRRIEGWVEWDTSGRALVIEVDDGTRFKLFLDGRRQRLSPAAPYRTTKPTRSPYDGTIAYVSTRDRNGRTCWEDEYGGVTCAPNAELYLRPPAGPRFRVTHSRVDEHDHTWSPDGRVLAFVSGGAIWLVGHDATQLRQLTGSAAGGPTS